MYSSLNGTRVIKSRRMSWAMHIAHKKLAGLVSGLQPRHYSSLPATNLQPTANQERNDQCGNQHYSRELLMMGVVVPETCCAYKKYNKIISGI